VFCIGQVPGSVCLCPHLLYPGDSCLERRYESGNIVMAGSIECDQLNRPALPADLYDGWFYSPKSKEFILATMDHVERRERMDLGDAGGRNACDGNGGSEEVGVPSGKMPRADSPML